MHHSEKPDGVEAMQESYRRTIGMEANDEMFKTLLEKEAHAQGLGATGEFPDGKLTESDEGEIKFGVAGCGSQIIVNFGKPVAWFAMDADHADSLGDLLKHKAEETRKYVIGQTKG